MLTYVIVLGVLALFIAVALLLRRESGVAAALRNELQSERTVSAELREKAGQFQGQLTVLEKAARVTADELVVADYRINELTREHAEAKSGLENANVRIHDLAEQLAQRVDDVRTLGDQVSALQMQQARAEASLESATQLKADAAAFFNEAEIRLSRTAVQALSEKGQELQAQSRSDLGLLLTPFAEKISAFQARAEQLYGDEAAQRLNLTGVVQQMATNQQRVWCP
jgi:DNA recombination protein RmuC